MSAEDDWAGMASNCPGCGIAIIIPTLIESDASLAPSPPVSEGTRVDERPESKGCAGASEYKYWAFISYSSKDKAWGSWLHGAIETYGIPAELVKRHQIPTGHSAPKRFHPVFRDRDELPASADLGAVIKKALDASHYLIVICSRNAAQSHWVNKEIETFLALGRRDHILAIIVDGEPNTGDARECFPPALRRFEPIAADARPVGDGKTNAKLKLLAGMLGVNFDSLKRRDALRRRRLLVRIVVGLGLLIVVMSMLMVVAVHQVRLAARRKQISETAAQKVEEARQQEEEARRKTEEAKREAAEAPRKAIEEKAKSAPSLYASDMIKIQDAWGRKDRARVVELLDGQRPERTGGVDLRGFEWHYWWAQTHKELLTIKGQGEIASVCFSPDGKHLVSLGDMVEVWDAITGRQLFVLKEDHWNSSYCYSSDGKLLASVGSGESVKLWDASDGRLLLTLQEDQGDVEDQDGMNLICFSPDGKRLALAGDTVKVWDTASGRVLLTIQEDSGGSSRICFSPDGLRLAMASEDQGVKVWDANSGKQLLTLKAEWSSASYAGSCSLSFSFDGKRLALALEIVKLWDAASGQELLTLPESDDNPRSVCFSPDGQRLVSSGDRLQVWDAADGKELRILQGYDDDATSACFSPDGQRIVSCSGARLKMWDATSGKGLFTLEAYAEVGSVCFSPDGKRLASVSGGHAVKVWDATGAAADPLESDTGEMCVILDRKQSASATRNAVAKGDAASSQELLTLQGNIEGTTNRCVSPDGKRVATTGKDGMVRVLDAASGQELLKLSGGGQSVWFSPDGKVLSARDDDGIVQAWNSAMDPTMGE